MKRIFFYCYSIILAVLSLPAYSDLIAFDLTPEGNKNLINYTNPYESAFSSSDDFFEVFAGNELNTLPSQLRDDSLSSTSDSLGLIANGYSNPIFAVSDTVNSDDFDNNLTAVWTFDVSEYRDLFLSFDASAMGDFESRDQFIMEYAWDDEERLLLTETEYLGDDSQAYKLAGGKSIVLDDPLAIDGTVLTNDFQLFSYGLVGRGRKLNFYFSAQTDGGNEVFAMQNLRVEGQRAVRVAEPSSIAMAMIWLGTLMLSIKRN